MVRTPDEQQVLTRFGDAVRAARAGAGMSQEDLAERAGVHRTYLGGIERGERNVAILNIVRIANALGVQPAELLKPLS